METDVAVFWLLVLTCISGLITVINRLRSAAFGWGVVYVGILLISLIGWLLGKSGLIYAGLTIWVVLVLLPALLSRVYLRHFLQQRYGAAYRIARIIRLLHPADGWIQQPEIIRALETAH